MLNKIMFVAHGDEGHNQWKCLACNAYIDAGYPDYEYVGDDRVLIGSNYKFCPICGVKFEGVHPNSKMDMRRYYPFDVTGNMVSRYNQMKWRAEGIRENRVRFINLMNEYRDQVAEFLDELDEYQCRDLKFCKPKFNNGRTFVI